MQKQANAAKITSVSSLVEPRYTIFIINKTYRSSDFDIIHVIQHTYS